MRHLYSAGRPSCWVLTHILVLICKNTDSATEIITVGICMLKIFQDNRMTLQQCTWGLTEITQYSSCYSFMLLFVLLYFSCYYQRRCVCGVCVCVCLQVLGDAIYSAEKRDHGKLASTDHWCCHFRLHWLHLRYCNNNAATASSVYIRVIDKLWRRNSTTISHCWWDLACTQWDLNRREQGLSGIDLCFLTEVTKETRAQQ